ncbi:serine/threonine-protein kinase [Streptomyces sp.]|uniref:serine/threonine-protein kinase n=1 Tax=Streptomyces sp. TaxID=1931 RepID=UPI002D77B397|nr:serine/threonine-protein kinase [Streptomyces sp.]HET6353489.1 serine/threonine-protein kinase [Streptomyces sp.]
MPAWEARWRELAAIEEAAQSSGSSGGETTTAAFTDDDEASVEPLEADDPARVGPFRLCGRLGVGGMGRVYLGHSPGERPVAVKVIHRDMAGDPEFRRRFRREVEAIRLVNNLYTAPLVAADPDAEQPWLATAYIHGTTLRETITRHGPLPLESVYRLAAGIAEALCAIHAVGVVHRDLKPANVLLAIDGPRVIDFGIARAADATHHTITGQTIGSPPYMSPEQARGGRIGPASDVFSLGAVLAYAATGNLVFGEGAAADVLYRIVHEPPRLEGLDDDLKSLIEACLHKDPDQRPSPADVLLRCKARTGRPAGATDAVTDWLPGAVLADITRRLRHTATVIDPPDQNGPADRQRRKPLVLVAVLLVFTTPLTVMLPGWNGPDEGANAESTRRPSATGTKQPGRTADPSSTAEPTTSAVVTRSPRSTVGPSATTEATTTVTTSRSEAPATTPPPTRSRQPSTPPTTHTSISRPTSKSPTSSSPQGFRVESSELRADPFTGTVSCDPAVGIHLSGRINVIGGAGTVSYRWVRSDGAQSDVRTLSFSGPGSQTVESDWQLGPFPPQTQLNEWEQVVILETTPTVRSPQAHFDVTCS